MFGILHSLVCFCRGFFSPSTKVAPRTPRRRLSMEGLEERTVPSMTILGTDDDGDAYKVVLAGPGQIDMTPSDGQGAIQQIFLEGVTTGSGLTITVTKQAGGNGLLDVGSIEVGGDLRSVSTPKCNLVGLGVSVAGYLASLSVNDVLNGAEIQSGGDSTRTIKIAGHFFGEGTGIFVQSVLGFTAAGFPSGEIYAPAISTLTVSSDRKLGANATFGPNIFLAGNNNSNSLTLRNAVIAGAVSGTWDIGGAVGTISIGGQVADWSLSVAGNLSSLKLNSIKDSAIDVAGTVAQVNVTGTFTSSYVLADSFGAVALNKIGTTEFDRYFGFTAHTSIGKLTAKSPAFTYKASDLEPQGVFNFVVQIG